MSTKLERIYATQCTCSAWKPGLCGFCESTGRPWHCESYANPPPRPPNDRGQGRKPLPPADKLVVGSVRLSPAQWEKLEKLGGAKWLRERIDRARL
jgi:hypothetical protein